MSNKNIIINKAVRFVEADSGNSVAEDDVNENDVNDNDNDDGKNTCDVRTKAKLMWRQYEGMFDVTWRICRRRGRGQLEGGRI